MSNPSLYAQYIKEREGKEIVESEYGFATFKIRGDECYIEDIYVVPEMRDHHIASHFADEISTLAKARGCAWLTGSVCPQANGATTSMKVLLAYGFKLLKSEPSIIYFVKELK